MNSIGVNELMNDLFVSESRENISENEISFVYEALYIINPQLRPINLKLISINENYDIFKFDSGDESYCLKLSLDGKCKAINHEIKFLKNINKIISPHFYSGGTIKIGENIKYILSSYENADSISEIGKSFLLENFHNFCETYSLMQNSKKINFTYKDYLKTKFYKKKINGYFLNFNLKKINKSIDLLKIEQIIKELESNIDSIYTEDMDSDKNICHGLLNPANIISRNGLFEFINFDNCFTGPFYLDFMEFILEINKVPYLLIFERSFIFPNPGNTPSNRGSRNVIVFT